MQTRGIALITNAQDAAWALDAQQCGALEGVRLVALSLRGRLAARAAGLNVETADWLAARLDRATIRKDARFFARFWSEFDAVRSLSVVDTLARWRGYPLLVMQSAHLSYWITEALTARCIAQLLCEHYAPDAVWLPPAGEPPAGYWCAPSVCMDADAIAEMCARRGVVVQRMSPPDAADRSNASNRIRNYIDRVWSTLIGGPVDQPATCEMIARSMPSLSRRGGKGLVLAVSHAYHYVQQMLPYVADLRRSGFDVLCALHESIDAEAIAQFDDADVERIELPPLVESTRTACDLAETATAAFRQVDAVMQRERLLCDRAGESLWPLVRPRFERLFAEDVPTTAAHLMTAERLMGAVSPDLMLAGLCESGIDAAYPFAARRAGCPSVSFQHGLILDGNAPFVAPATDTFALWGQSTRRQLQHLHGTSPDAVPVVGHAAFNEQPMDAPKSTVTAQRLGLDASRPVCLFLGAMGWATNDVDRYAEQRILSTVFDLEREIPGLQLILRLHAGEDVTALRVMADMRSSAAVVQPVAALADLLSVCDIVVTQTTTGGLEALLAGRPIVYLNMCSERDWLPYATSGAATGVYAPEDLADAVRQTLDGLSESPETNAVERRRFFADTLEQTGVMAADAMTQLCAQRIHERRCRSHTDALAQSPEFADVLMRSRAFADRPDAAWTPPLPAPAFAPQADARREAPA